MSRSSGVSPRRSDATFIREALALAARNLGRTAPNPSVGAVIVDEAGDQPTILARAVTAPGGRPHAERLALDALGERARGATLFVTLEPCAHHGRTPPCAEAVIAAGIRRVVCGLEDPDKRVAGKGFAKLREAGIEVALGPMEAECRKTNAGHVARVTLGRPLLCLKLAMTADAFAARAANAGVAGPVTDRLIITGPIANAQTHLLRARSDAVLVGIGTVLADDPELTCRLPGLAERSPLRVVLDSRLRISLDAKLVRSARETPTLVIAREEAPRDKEARLREQGVEVAQVPAAADGAVDLDAAMRFLAARGVTRLLCEGGPALAEALARRDLVDELVCITGSAALGAPGLKALGPSLEAELAQRHLVAAESLAFGEDRWVRYERSSPCSPAS